MSELRAGGLALVFGLIKDAHENGKSATLISKCDVQDSEEKCWKVEGDFIAKNGEAGVGYFWSRNLMPIDGENFSHEDERQKELTNG